MVQAYRRWGEISVRKHKRVAAPRMLQAYLAVTFISRGDFPPFINFHRNLAISVVCKASAAFDRMSVQRCVKVGTVALREGSMIQSKVKLIMPVRC